MKLFNLIKKVLGIKKKRTLPYVPPLAVLKINLTKNIASYKIKYIEKKDCHNILGSGWFLVNSHYPDRSILKKREIGANIISKTRYILKPGE